MEERQSDLRQPPHSVDAERSVLGSMLLEANALEIALEQLRPEDFYLPAHEAICACMRCACAINCCILPNPPLAILHSSPAGPSTL